MEKDYLYLMNEQIEKEKEKFEDYLKNLKRLREMNEVAYKNGFRDCLKFLGVINKNDVFDIDNEIYLAIFKKIGMDGLKEMVQKYYMDKLEER